MPDIKRRRALKALAWAALAVPGFCVAGSASAANWPEKPVKLVVPWSPGGITDTVGRLLAQKFGEQFGQQFIVENRPGASGNIGAEMVAHAKPNGYTLMLTNPGAFVTNQFLYSNLGYKPSDFADIAVVAQFPNALMVNKDVPAKTAQELIDYAKAHPGKLTGASSGVGSSGYLSLELFKNMAGLDIVHVPYDGAAASRVDLAAGRVQVVVDNIPGYLGALQDGSVRMLAVGTRKRLDKLPDVPTLDESGLPGFQAVVWYALAAPKGTPKDIMEKLNTATNAALKDPEIAKRLSDLYAVPMGGSPDDARSFMKDETKRWKGVIKAAGIKIQ